MLELNLELRPTHGRADVEGYARLAAGIILRAESGAGRGVLSEAA